MTIKLKPEIKEKWIAALRSGEYRQASHLLYDLIGNSYCCLGVLCDVVAKETGEDFVEFAYNEDRETYEQVPNLRLKEFVSNTPLSSRERTDNRLAWGVITPVDKEGTTLYTLNDEGVSFAKIANLIEEQF